MAKEICISSTPHETRLAILEDDQLAEIYYERENEYTLAGSIYNGRVTRVLPGMQSAFVDLGLERDAFLYVTDFIELEDQEETDELEKAAATGQAPREVRHPQGAGATAAARKNAARVRTKELNQDRSRGRNARSPIAARTKKLRLRPRFHPLPRSSGQPEAPQEPDDAGARRWRGRRRRRGGRGPGSRLKLRAKLSRLLRAARNRPQNLSSPRQIQMPRFPSSASTARTSSSRGLCASRRIAFEVWRRARGGNREACAAEQPLQPAPPAFKPSTLIEAPIEWDGSGLLPGESLSRHRSRQPEPEIESSEIESTDEPQADSPADRLFRRAGQRITQDETLEETRKICLPRVRKLRRQRTRRVPSNSRKMNSRRTPPSRFQRKNHLTWKPPCAVIAEDPAPTEEEDADASASHRIDPSSPTGFRLFGFGKKKDIEPAPEAKKSAATASTYAPGAGLVEEEVIEGEELDATLHPRRHKPEAHDLDDYEEETLPTHLRTGDLGEMLQEAHLDHRIQLNFDEKGGEEEEIAEEEEETATGAPAAPGRERRDRGGRQQRGRGVQGNRRGPRAAQRRPLTCPSSPTC